MLVIIISSNKFFFLSPQIPHEDVSLEYFNEKMCFALKKFLFGKHFRENTVSEKQLFSFLANMNWNLLVKE